MTSMTTLAGAVAFAAAATLVTEPPTTAGGPVVPSDRWQSEGLKAAVSKLRQGFIGADLSMANTLGLCFAAVGFSRPEKNRFNPNFPLVDMEDCMGASEQFFEALELALQWTDRQLAIGATETRGMVRLVSNDTSGGIGLPTFVLNTVAAARLRAGEELVPGWQLTELGRQYQRAANNYRIMQFLAGKNGGSDPSHYLLATWWRQLWLTAEWADTAGAPLGGEEWDEGGVLGSILVGAQTASGWLASGFVAVGGAVASVIGDAAWSVLASPPGLLAVVGGMWILKSRAIV